MSMIEQTRKNEYRITLQKALGRSIPFKEILDWCRQTFGPCGKDKKWRFGWDGGHNFFDTSKSFIYFTNEADALFFVMRWQ